MKAAPHAPAAIALLAAALLSGCGGSSKPSATASSSSSSRSSTAVTKSSTSTAATSVASTSAAVTGTQSAPGVIAASAGEVAATLHAGTHSPRVKAAWPISFTVAQAGRPVKAKVSYEYLFAGAVVAKRSNYTFTGHFSDVFRWPGQAAGYPLTFRAVVLAGGRTLYLDYPVKVVR
jgi:hypothetical protein